MTSPHANHSNIPVPTNKMSSPTISNNKNCISPKILLKPQVTEPDPTTCVDRARKIILQIQSHMRESKNIKTEIKNGVLEKIQLLLALVKEASGTNNNKNPKNKKIEQEKTRETEIRELLNKENSSKEEEKIKENQADKTEINELKNLIEEQTRLLRKEKILLEQNNERMEILGKTLEIHRKEIENKTYASVTAGQTGRQIPIKPTLHSILISSKDETETGDEILKQIKETINAKESDIKIEKIRKAKDRKIILSCSNEEERKKVKEKLQETKHKLNVDDIKNKNPLIIMKGVLVGTKDEDIIKQLKNRHTDIFTNKEEIESKIEIIYKRKVRNPHINHVVIRVIPQIWKKMTQKGFVHIDMLKIKVEDQSPLIQCSMCLGYGHGRKYCPKEIEKEKCSYCSEQHLKINCEIWKAEQTPTCINCVHAKNHQTNHTAFSKECPVRARWEALARASIAYC